MAKRKIVKKKVVRKSIAKGIVYISATFNNTMVTVTDEMGNATAWSSAGGLVFTSTQGSVEMMPKYKAPPKVSLPATSFR